MLTPSTIKSLISHLKWSHFSVTARLFCLSAWTRYIWLTRKLEEFISGAVQPWGSEEKWGKNRDYLQVYFFVGRSIVLIHHTKYTPLIHQWHYSRAGIQTCDHPGPHWLYTTAFIYLSQSWFWNNEVPLHRKKLQSRTIKRMIVKSVRQDNSLFCCFLSPS